MTIFFQEMGAGGQKCSKLNQNKEMKKETQAVDHGTEGIQHRLFCQDCRLDIYIGLPAQMHMVFVT